MLKTEQNRKMDYRASVFIVVDEHDVLVTHELFFCSFFGLHAFSITVFFSIRYNYSPFLSYRSTKAGGLDRYER